jgi:hypothetical protein
MWTEALGLSYLGIFFGVAIVIGYLGGSWADRRFHTVPWLSIAGRRPPPAKTAASEPAPSEPSRERHRNVNVKPQLRHLLSVEKWTLLCGAVLITLSFVFMGAKGQLAVCVGAGLMALNARILRVVADRLLRVYGSGEGARPLPLGLLLLLFNGKLLGLALLIYICVAYLKVEPLPFLLGISILPAAILLSAVSRGLSQPPEGVGEG